MMDTVSFGYWVRRQRKALDLTQYALAHRVGCALVTIRKIENDSRRPSRRLAELLAEQLAIPAAERPLFLQCALGERSPVQLALPRRPAAQLGPTTRQTQTNLPSPLTPLVGRVQAIRSLCELLRRRAVRLVTLTGPGGVGKTRLALQVAADLLDDFADGAYFVPLAPIREAPFVISAIAQTLSIRDLRGLSPVASVVGQLQGREILLVLDNFEHLLPAAPLVTELLAHCPRLKILVTSRAVLHLYGEHEFAVPSLAMPAPEQSTPPVTLSQYEAVQLFIQRAQAVKPDFVVDNASAPAVAEICIRLDGLPLAIELAAARSKFFSPQVLLGKLSLSALEFLQGGARDRPDRHQTLRRAIAWSYDLLSPAEQTLFRRLSVFIGGFNLEAAEAVCNLETDLDLDVVNGMLSLVDKSLVQQTIQADGQPRFSLLETVREFGLGALRTHHEAELAERGHAEHFLALAVALAPGIHGGDSIAIRARLAAEHGNLRAALHWVLREQAVEAGLRLVGSLYRLWTDFGYFGEARDYLRTVLAMATGSPPSAIYAKALFAAGFLEHSVANYRTAQLFYEQSLAMGRQLGDKRRISHAAALLANVLFDRGDFQASQNYMEEGLQTGLETAEEWHCALIYTNMANQAVLLGNFTEAESLFEQALTALQQIGDKWSVGLGFYHAAKMAYYQGDYTRARALILESRAAEEAVSTRNTFYASACRILGLLDCERADFSSAYNHLVEALTIVNELGNKRDMAYAFDAFVQLAAAQQQPLRALHLAGASAALRTEMGFVLPPVERSRLDHLCATARRHLSADEADAAWAEGAAMTLDEAVAYALAA